jgi:hypothetical protein
VTSFYLPRVQQLPAGQIWAAQQHITPPDDDISILVYYNGFAAAAAWIVFDSKSKDVQLYKQFTLLCNKPPTISNFLFEKYKEKSRVQQLLLHSRARNVHLKYPCGPIIPAASSLAYIIQLYIQQLTKSKKDQTKKKGYSR